MKVVPPLSETFGEGKNNPLLSTTLGQFACKIIINNHGVDVSMNIIII
jgi:hypothetical protein